MDNNRSIEIFSESDILALEMLEIKGGRAMYNADIQVGQVCTGDIGCTGDISCTNDQCTYSGNCVSGCACKGDPT